MISKLATSWIILTISLTLTPDQCFANNGATVPLDHANPSKGTPVGKLLPQEKFDKLCAAQPKHNLCKDCMQGVLDMNQECAAVGKELGFKVAECKEIIPDKNDMKTKYNVCSLANSKLPLGDPNWYYVTCKDLNKSLLHNQSCRNNGLSAFIVKV
ncbi:hypothetical protein WDU94_001951 [Cyamophila willieti]